MTVVLRMKAQQVGRKLCPERGRVMVCKGHRRGQPRLIRTNGSKAEATVDLYQTVFWEIVKTQLRLY